MINITIIPILNDNYTYLLQADNGDIGIVDPGDAAPIIKHLKENDLKLTHILNTHHHYDHVDGNIALKDKYRAKVIAPKKDKERIPGFDIGVSEGSIFSFGLEDVKILEVPGHTLGGICFYFPKTRALFTGDTLFSMGCGRLFEGTPDQMWDSMQKIMTLPDDTKLYCGHEYTQDNGVFSLTIEPENDDIIERLNEVCILRLKEEPTIPSSLGLEKKTNPFLRAGSAQRLAEIRALKDNF